MLAELECDAGSGRCAEEELEPISPPMNRFLLRDLRVVAPTVGGVRSTDADVSRGCKSRRNRRDVKAGLVVCVEAETRVPDDPRDYLWRRMRSGV